MTSDTAELIDAIIGNGTAGVQRGAPAMQEIERRARAAGGVESFRREGFEVELSPYMRALTQPDGGDAVAIKSESGWFRQVEAEMYETRDDFDDAGGPPWWNNKKFIGAMLIAAFGLASVAMVLG